MTEAKIVWQTIKRIVKQPNEIRHMRTRFDLRMLLDLLITRDYTEANRRRMNRRIRHDPKIAVGGWDTGIGELQYEFLVNRGLTPSDTLLDLGCGTLRGGRYYIEYLDAGNYVGMDISEEALKKGRELLTDDLVSEKEPNLIRNSNLEFAELDGWKFEFIIAQSVFTHLPKREIEECFANIGKILSHDGVFYATFFESKTDSVEIDGPSSFNYHSETLKELADSFGLSADVVPKDDYPHPRGQRMLRITHRQT